MEKAAVECIGGDVLPAFHAVYDGDAVYDGVASCCGLRVSRQQQYACVNGRYDRAVSELEV